MYNTSTGKECITENWCINELALTRLRQWETIREVDELPKDKSTITFNQVAYKPEYLKVNNRYINISDEYVVAGMQHIDNMLSIMKFPDKWETEKVAEPTQLCKMLTKDVAISVFYNEKIMPIRVSPCIEEGITLTYYKPESNRSLIIEIYNDGDIAGLVNQDKTILLSRDIVDDKFEELLSVFRCDP